MIEIIDDIGSGESCEFCELLESVACFSGEKMLGHSDFEVTVTLTDGETIRQINNEHRGIDSETDVLSFPLWDVRKGEAPFENPDTGCIMLGDIVISLPRLKEQAEEYGHSEKREAAYLLIHGMLHLLGYDHENGGLEQTIMREKEEAILDLLGLAINKV